MGPMSLLPTGWSSPCRRSLSYWHRSPISARATRCNSAPGAVNPPSLHRAGSSYAEKVQRSLLFPLRFVRCGVCCCGAVAIALPPPSLGVSSLDLGRLHPQAALFSVLDRSSRDSARAVDGVWTRFGLDSTTAAKRQDAHSAAAR